MSPAESSTTSPGTTSVTATSRGLPSRITMARTETDSFSFSAAALARYSWTKSRVTLEDHDATDDDEVGDFSGKRGYRTGDEEDNDQRIPEAGEVLQQQRFFLPPAEQVGAISGKPCFGLCPGQARGQSLAGQPRLRAAVQATTAWRVKSVGIWLLPVSLARDNDSRGHSDIAPLPQCRHYSTQDWRTSASSVSLPADLSSP